MRKLTTEEFIQRAKEIHGNKYDYSKVEYKNSDTRVCIICPAHGEFWQRPSRHLCGGGCSQCPHTFGAYGIIDVKGATNDKSYRKWKSMLNRCYSVYYHKNKPTYIDCKVCDEWHIFSNFKKWFDANYIEGCHLDKDILVKGNKLYSPDTCCFIPAQINSLFTKRNKDRGTLPIGVALHDSKYQAHFCGRGKLNHLGTFDTPEEAFYAYKKAKEQYIKELAEKYFQEGKITEKVYNALMKYEVEITD